MPHVVLDAEPDLAAALEAFEAAVHQDEGRVVKTQEAFLDRDETNLLVTGLAIQQGNKADAIVRVTRREGDAVVRLDEQFKPDVTDAVKRLVACVACLVLDGSSAEIERTNVQAQLDALDG